MTCRPAAPPNARSAKRRGSTPRRTETRRMPSAMRVLTTRWMPSAAAMRSTPSACAIRSTAASAARRSSARAPAEEVVGVEKAEHQVGVGHGRLRAAPAVAGGPGLGAGALGPDMQHAAGVDPRDRAAAGADADDVERLQARRAGRRAAGPRRSGRRRPTTSEMSVLVPPMSNRIRSGWPIRRAAWRLPATPPAGPGEHAAGGEAHRIGDGRDAAVRLDDQDRPAIARLASGASRGGRDSAASAGPT